MTLALFIEAGTVSGMMRYPLLAAACFALSAALLTALGMAAGAVPQPKHRGLPVSAIASLLPVLLAAGLTVGTLTRGSMRSYHRPEDLSFRPNPGLLGTVRALLSQSLYDRGPRMLRKASGTHRPAAVGAPRYEPAGDIGRVGDNEFPGVILWTEVMPETTLVAPILSGTSFSAHATRPLGIRFRASTGCSGRRTHGLHTARSFDEEAQRGLRSALRTTLHWRWRRTTGWTNPSTCGAAA
ncbi:MAG: hypothetical protein ABSB23_05020 [Bryobacteraceae bacterium]